MTTATEKKLAVVPEPLPTVFQAIRAMMRDLGVVGKNSQNREQGYTFRGIDDVMAAVHDVAAEHGVFFTPDVIERIPEQRETSSKKQMNVMNLHVEFTFYGPAGDSVKATTWGEGQDMADKATNKAMSAALKYVLVQVLCIKTKNVLDEADATTTETSRASDPQEIAALELKLEQATTKQSLRALYAECKVAFMAKRINGQDLERIQAECTERAKILDAENAAEQHEQDKPEDPRREEFAQQSMEAADR